AVATPTSGRSFDAPASFTDQLGVLDWNMVGLYPTGRPSDSLTYEASLRLPPGWTFATALPPAGEVGGEIRFRPTSLTTLVDSPVLAGVHMRSVPLTVPGDPRPVRLEMACDSEEGLAISRESIEH